MKLHGLTSSHISRLITADDFRNYKHILCMDEKNLSDLEQLAPEDSQAQVELLGNYDTEGSPIIVDPYYTVEGKAEFEAVYQQCKRCCTAFLDSKQ